MNEILISLFSPDITMMITLAIGGINLLTPFITKSDSAARTIGIIIVSLMFIFNVLILDSLFLANLKIDFSVFEFDKYCISFHLEPLGLIFLNLLAALWLFAQIYTVKFLKINDYDKRSSSKFLFFVNATVYCGVLVSISGSLLTMYIFYELLTLCTLPLIGFSGGLKVQEGLFRYIKILILSSVTLFLPAILVIYSYVGHCSFIEGGIMGGNFERSTTILLLLMFIFGISKTALFPLHVWLPAAMVASYPVSALLHAVVVVKTGLFCIYKILVYIFSLSYLHEIFSDHNWIIYFPIITIIYSSMQALRYNKIKMILAYSTINQLSIALLAAFLFTPRGIVAAVLHMVSHAFTKICLFYGAGIIYSVRNSYYVSELTSMGRLMPIVSSVLLISSLSLMGIPPFAGFISKFYVLLAAAEENSLMALAAIIFSSIFSALYMIKILSNIYKPAHDVVNLVSKIKLPFRLKWMQNLVNSKTNSKLKEDEEAAAAHLTKLNDKITSIEYSLPKGMIISLIFCLLGVVFFIFIKQMIIKLLLFI